MSDIVEVPFGDDPSKTATLLLAAAADLDMDAGVVGTSSDQTFKVPTEVAEKAGVSTGNDEPEPQAPTEPRGEAYDPGEHTVNEVKAYVEDNPDEAQAVLDAEQAGENRVTLVAWLEGQAEGTENGSDS